MMNKRNTVFVRVLALFLSLMMCDAFLCACQTDRASESTNGAGTISGIDGMPKWKSAYLDFLETEKNTHTSYALVYIDEDNIPELYLSGIGEAIGDSICTYKNGAVLEQPLYRIGGGWYVERSGYVINQNGHMGQIHTHTYKLNEDGFELIFNARSSERIEEDLETGEALFYYEYSIRNQTVSEADYHAAINANNIACDFKNALQLNANQVDYDLVRKQILEQSTNPGITEHPTYYVFNTKDIKRITFYAYNGYGIGSDVPAEDLDAIITWFGTFKIDVNRKFPDVVPPGENTIQVEIEYFDGNIVKYSMDSATINGVTYYLSSDAAPDCYEDIIAKTSIKDCGLE